jgi:hypothetical protein
MPVYIYSPPLSKHLRNMHFHLWNKEINSSRGIMLRMLLTAIITSMDSQTDILPTFFRPSTYLEVTRGKILALGQMGKSCDSEAIKFSRCLMRLCIIKIERKYLWPGSSVDFVPSLRLDRPQLWIENSRLNVSPRGKMTKLPIAEREKKPTSSPLFAPIDCPTRVGFAISTLSHTKDRGLLQWIHVSSSRYTFASWPPDFDSRNSRSVVDKNLGEHQAVAIRDLEYLRVHRHKF